MDFSNRNVQSQGMSPSGPSPAASNGSRKSKTSDKTKWVRAGIVALVVAVIILLGAALVSAIANSNNGQESKYVDTTKLQAVFLNTGQVYFGNVQNLNKDYLVLTNIYYLQTTNTGSSQNAKTNVTLVKLGCELHEPYDRMIINQDQVTFWENLQDNGQVAKAVATFEKQNPKGQKCADQSSSASSSSGSNAQNANTGSSSSSPNSSNP